MARPSYDALAVPALLDPSPARSKARLQALQAMAEGFFDCPDCGDPGPHDTQSYMGQEEFACRACGMQHPCPEPPAR